MSIAAAAALAAAAACGGAQTSSSQQSQAAAPAAAENRPGNAQASGEEKSREASSSATESQAPAKSDRAGSRSAGARGERRASSAGKSRAEEREDGSTQAAASREAESRAPAEPAVRMVTVPEGKRLKTELSVPLSSKTSHVGDTFEATVKSDVRIPELDVVAIPVGSLVRGEVIEVRPAKALKGQALLSVKVNTLRLPSGKEIPVLASLVTEGQDTTKRSVGGIAGGAAAGALLGRILGKNTKGAAVGAVAGAAIGTGVVLGMDNKDITLPEGTEMTFHFDQSVEVPVKQPRL